MLLCTGKDSLFLSNKALKPLPTRGLPTAPLYGMQKKSIGWSRARSVNSRQLPFSFSMLQNTKNSQIRTSCFLPNSSKFKTPDIIFLDPMFPPKRKSVLPKKNGYLFGACRSDHDQETLLRWLTCHKESLLKDLFGRPTRKPCPWHKLSGKTVKFDTYFPTIKDKILKDHLPNSIKPFF